MSVFKGNHGLETTFEKKSSVFESMSSEKKSFISLFCNLFREREIMLRSGKDLQYFRLSSSLQCFLFSCILFGSLWVTYSSVSYFQSSRIIDLKDSRIKEARSEYVKLQHEMATYNETVLATFEKLNKNHDEYIKILGEESVLGNIVDNAEFKLPETNQDKKKVRDAGIMLIGRLQNFKTELAGKKRFFNDEEQEAVDNLILAADKELLNKQERDSLKKHILLASQEVKSLTEKRKWGEGYYQASGLSYDVVAAERKSELLKKERDNALNELNEMRLLVAEMRDVQHQVFNKVAQLASNGIKTLQENLSEVDKTMKQSGSGIDKLLGISNMVGQGGPFVPAELPDLADEELNLSLNSLMLKIEKWDFLYSVDGLMPLGKPLDKIRITASYGYRKDPFNGKRSKHEGIDLGGWRGDPVYVTAPGTVVRAGKWGWYGNMIEVKHSGGFRTRYAHLSKILVKRGQQVNTGDKIGLVGNTGRSTGSHLHYEIRKAGQTFNPIQFIRTNHYAEKKG